MPSSDRPTCFLFDNGSLRSAATLSLRRLAAALSPVIAADVRPVSLLHSSGVDPAELGGVPAELLEPALVQFGRRGGRAAVALPLFFGPSAALTEYLPARLAAVQRQQPALVVHQAQWLVAADDDSGDAVARMLADAVRTEITARGLTRPHVLVTDHGSPQRAVTDVRNALGGRVRALLGDAVAEVGVASMERRPQEAYAFNEPLLERALRGAGFGAGDVVVALQFLQAGRHAGADGDIARICAEAERESPGLRTFLTEPLASDPRLLPLLARRYAEALREPGATPVS